MNPLSQETIIESPIPLLDGAMWNNNPANSFGVTGTTTPGSVSSSTVLSAPIVPEKPLPQPTIAVETISQSLNTQARTILGNFTFGQLGAIQIGKYVYGLTGQLTITEKGITAENVNGQTTFTIDGTTGNATFLGTVQAGSVLSGSLTLGGSGNGNGTMTIADAAGHSIITGDNLGHHYYDTAGHELVRLSSSGLINYDTSGNKLASMDGNGILLYQQTSIQFTDPTAGNIGYIGPYNGGVWFSAALGVPMKFQMIGGCDMYVGSAPSYTGILNVHGTFQVNGTTKTAIVPTTAGYKALYCAESPEVWFFDFAPNKDSIDPLFLEATEGEMKTLKTEEGELLVFRRRKGYSAERFTPKTVEEFNRNNQFWAQAQTK